MFGFLAGFITSLLSGLGIGGGGLLVIYLAFFTSTPQIKAQGINLIFFIFSSTAAMLIHLKRRKIPFLLVFTIAVAGMAGAILGSITATSANEVLIKRLFGVLLTVSGFIALCK